MKPMGMAIQLGHITSHGRMLVHAWKILFADAFEIHDFIGTSPPLDDMGTRKPLRQRGKIRLV